MENVSFVMAFAAGFLAFLSPCVLPLIPSYLSYLTGISFNELSDRTDTSEKKRITMITSLHALSFIAGFTLVFVFLGATATFFGQLLFQHKLLLSRIGGVLVICFGCVIAGIVKLPFLERQKSVSYRKQSVSVIGSVLVGATFAFAWTPCIGPILGSILIYASNTASAQEGIKLLIAFSLGLGIPFFLSALAVNSLLTHIKRIQRYMKWVKILAGSVLVIFGIFLLIGGR